MITIIRGEDRTLVFTFTLDADGTPFQGLVGATEVEFKMRNEDGTALSKKMTDSQVTILSAVNGQLSVALTNTDTEALAIGSRGPMEIIVDVDDFRRIFDITKSVIVADPLL